MHETAGYHYVNIFDRYDVSYQVLFVSSSIQETSHLFFWYQLGHYEPFVWWFPFWHSPRSKNAHTSTVHKVRRIRDHLKIVIV